jgi:nucleoside-diphosphate-sugar epimerase
MRALVTGAAGFVGSHLCELLVASGDEVVGVDAFTSYYAREIKEHNLAHLRTTGGFTLVESDLADAPLEPLLDGVEVVYHIAGQPGVRASWGADFATYLRNNALATQRLLEACTGRDLQKFVFASSSSIYGDAESHPTPESLLPRPVSPYGVTKLAAEHLCSVYRTNFGVPTAALRLFTVFGPRQRPDMAMARLVKAGLAGEPFTMYGDGSQARDFTYVGDVVRAMRDAARSPWCGVANIGGGASTTLRVVVDILEQLCGPLDIHTVDAQAGDVRVTSADITLASQAFGYAPTTSVAAGLADMVTWRRDLMKVSV